MIGLQASAQDWSSGRHAAEQASVATASAKIVHLSGSITGTAVVTSGGCTQGFSNQCPSGHTCDCYTAMGAKFSSSGIGKGAANLFATFDLTAAFGPLGGDCVPLDAEIDVIAKKDSPTFDVVGGACIDSKDNVVSNGTMGLASSDLFVETGYATYSSTITNSGNLSLSFKGAAQ